MHADDDVCLTFTGQVLRGSDVLSERGVDDGSTVHMIERLRGGGMHKNKKSQGGTEKKQDMNPKGPGQPQGRNRGFREPSWPYQKGTMTMWR